jgi:hypothetical protein
MVKGSWATSPQAPEEAGPLPSPAMDGLRATKHAAAYDQTQLTTALQSGHDRTSFFKPKSLAGLSFDLVAFVQSIDQNLGALPLSIEGAVDRLVELSFLG